MVFFGIYNIVISIILIFVSITSIKDVNKDIKEDKAYKKKYNAEWIDEYIKSHKKFKIFNYIIFLFSVLLILYSLFIFIIKFMEVL